MLEAPDEDVSRAFAAEWFSRAGAGTPVDRALRLDTEVMLVEDTVIDRPKGYFPVRRDAVEAMLSDPNADRTNLDGSSLWQLGPLEL